MAARDPVIVGVGLSDAPKAPHLDAVGHHVQAIQRALDECALLCLQVKTVVRMLGTRLLRYLRRQLTHLDT